MRIAVIGSRGISESAYGLLEENIPLNCTEIVSGGSDGIDALAERYAHEHGLKLTVFHPDYGVHGKKAPLVRNLQIIKYAQSVLAFWNGQSRGTAFVVTECVKANRQIKVVRV